MGDTTGREGEVSAELDSEIQDDEYVPRCPICGDKATFVDSMGTYWDGNAHRWRVQFEPIEESTR